METVSSPWETAFSFLLKPRLLLQGVVEYISAWLFTRPWLKSLLLYSPVWITCTAAVAIVSYGSWIDRYDLIRRYATWVEEEMPSAMAADTAQDDGESGTGTPNPVAPSAADKQTQDAQEGAEAAVDEATGDEAAELAGLDDLEEVSPYGQLLLRRLLQLEQANSRITYLVALQLAAQGRTGQTHQMMRRIAPEGGGGFPPAHAWLAVDRLNSQKTKTEQDLELLAADLDTARRWSGINSELISVYSDLLESQGKVTDAMAVLENAGSENPSLTIKLANMASRHGHKQRLDRVAGSAKEDIHQRMKNDSATIEDYVHLANLFLLEQNTENALIVVKEGLKKDPGNAALRRLRSEAYRIQYITTARFDGEQASVNLSLLDAALKSDPTNPAVGIEIARLIAAGQEASPELHAALARQLADGQATAITHILLANRKLMDDEIREAVPHLESALRQAPNSPMVMNNLALALAKTSPDQLDRALNLSLAANSASPNNPTYLDTLGDIRDLTGDQLGAIESYEAVIGLDGSHDDSRRKLASLYRQLGMLEMANIQEQELQKRQQ